MSDEGAGAIIAGEDVPDGFPLPIAPGCVVVGGTSIESPEGRMMSVSLEMPSTEAETVADLYEQQFEALGFSVMRQTGSGGSAAIILTAVDEGGGDRAASPWIDMSGDTAKAALLIGGDL